MGLLGHARPGAIGTREGAPLVPEQFVADRLHPQGSTVEDPVGLVAAESLALQLEADQFLAGPVLARDQDGIVQLGHIADAGFQFEDGRRAAQDVPLRLGAARLAAEPLLLEGAVQGDQEGILADRLAQEVEDPVAQRLLEVLDIDLGGEDQHGPVEALRAQLGQQIQPAPLLPAEVQVQDQRLGLPLPAEFVALVEAQAAAELDLIGLKQALDGHADAGIVVDHQHATD